MMKPDAASDARPPALVLTPEPPEPATGGGALRLASLLAYLRARYTVEVIAFGQAILLPYHSRRPAARAWRNARRVLGNVPPLADRFRGFERRLEELLGGRRFELGVIEHFWCAPYADVLARHCARLVLDLHNVESELAASRARAAWWPLAAAHARFARAYREMEQAWLPRFDGVLVASEEDAWRVRNIAPASRVHVYRNALAGSAPPARAEEECLVFSGNLEYDPNVEAVRWLRRCVWPRLRVRWPRLEWRLVGKNAHAVARIVAGDPRIRLIGSVEDAIAELAAAKVCVVPVLSGSGTRFKILEAWAAERAVVSTALGAEGLGATSGEHLLLADHPEAFAEAVSRVLGSAGLRARLGAAGRKLLLERFTWEAAWRALENVGI